MKAAMVKGLVSSPATILVSVWRLQYYNAAFCFSPQTSNNYNHASFTTSSSDDDFFDPFLHSPHDYPDGVDNGPDDRVAPPNGLESIDEIFDSGSSFGFSSISAQPSPIDSSESPQTVSYNNADLFDPLLSPHAYPDGTAAGPVTEATSQTQSAAKKLGILLIDHGSKREASNQHLQFIAETYEASIIQRGASEDGEGMSATMKRETVVRAAHMEIAEPSILTSLVSAVCSSVVCDFMPFIIILSNHSYILWTSALNTKLLMTEKHYYS